MKRSYLSLIKEDVKSFWEEAGDCVLMVLAFVAWIVFSMWLTYLTSKYFFSSKVNSFDVMMIWLILVAIIPFVVVCVWGYIMDLKKRRGV